MTVRLPSGKCMHFGLESTKEISKSPSPCILLYSRPFWPEYHHSSHNFSQCLSPNNYDPYKYTCSLMYNQTFA